MTAAMTGPSTSESNGHSSPMNGRTSSTAGELIARGVCAWFGSRLVLEDVNLDMERSRVTALIGPSGCGKSTFIRTLNRMHEVVPSAQLAGSVELDGSNIYAPDQRANEVRQNIGMVFQRPNPFPAMSIYDNVLAGLRFTRTKSGTRMPWSRSRWLAPACGPRSRTGSATLGGPSLVDNSSASASHELWRSSPKSS